MAVETGLQWKLPLIKELLMASEEEIEVSEINENKVDAMLKYLRTYYF